MISPGDLLLLARAQCCQPDCIFLHSTYHQWHTPFMCICLLSPASILILSSHSANKNTKHPAMFEFWMNNKKLCSTCVLNVPSDISILKSYYLSLLILRAYSLCKCPKRCIEHIYIKNVYLECKFYRASCILSCGPSSIPPPPPNLSFLRAGTWNYSLLTFQCLGQYLAHQQPFHIYWLNECINHSIFLKYPSCLTILILVKSLKAHIYADIALTAITCFLASWKMSL